MFLEIVNRIGEHREHKLFFSFADVFLEEFCDDFIV